MSESFNLGERLLGTKDVIRDVKKENDELRKLSDLEIEDYLLVVGIEQCSNCGTWVDSNDIVDDVDDEPYCSNCD